MYCYSNHSLSLSLNSTGNECDPNDLSDPENGMATFDSVSLGSVATYTCNQTYNLSGPAKRTCVRIGANTVWSGEAPMCERKNAREKKNQSLTYAYNYHTFSHLHCLTCFVSCLCCYHTSLPLMHTHSDSVSPTFARQWDDHHDIEHSRLPGLPPV